MFRRRGLLPLAFIPLLILGVSQMAWPLGSYRLHLWVEVLSLLTSFLGLAVRVHVVGHAPENTSGRNTRGQVADTLNTTGMYSVVRHPLYFGNYLIGLGVTLIPLGLWLPLVYTLGFWVYYERIMLAEEQYLRSRFPDEFNAWAERTPAFVPRLSGWLPPTLPFSLRNVLRREYSALALIVLLHASVEQAEHWFIERRLVFEPVWFALLMTAVTAYVVLRWLKKHTSVLTVAGR